MKGSIIILGTCDDLKTESPLISFASADVGSGKICRDLVRQEAKVHNARGVFEITLPLGAADCTTQVISLKKRKPDYVIIYGFPANTTAFFRDAMRLGLSTPFIVLQYGCVESTVRIAGKSAQNMTGLNCFSSWDEESQGMKKMREITYRYHPDSGRRDRNYIQGWMLGFLIGEGLKNAGKDLNREAFVKGLEAINNFDTKGICGIMDYGPDDHKPIDYSRFYKADTERGRLIPITDWRKPKGS
ncbi:MAG: ABC transporter substrate-binding protein [Thermodesulfobacteriota bacterium]|nr:ABC transporter substrate-binding protein [Thermodesulfobacteriota bacterium]